MDDQKKELRETMWTNTEKLAMGTKDISATIGWKDWTKITDKNRITTNLDKREKELWKKRMIDNKTA